MSPTRECRGRRARQKAREEERERESKLTGGPKSEICAHARPQLDEMTTAHLTASGKMEGEGETKRQDK
eukprot:6597708-Pyramimonas_sp.AAC.2